MFGFSELLADFKGESRQQILNALYLLRQKGILFSPYRAFYVILPPQYRLIGSVPPSYYIDYLMKMLGKRYYFGLLSAAKFHGAAHQRPMVDVVMTERPKLTAPKTESRLVRFVYRQDIPNEFLLEKNGEGGIVRYSNAELTAVELVQYEQHAAGLSHVATVLEELLEVTDFAHASDGVFKVCKDSAIQRLGYLVEREIGDEHQGEVIYHEWVRACKAPHFVPLALQSGASTIRRDERWKVDVNVKIERDEL